MLAGSKFSRLSNFKRLSLQDALHNSVKGTTGNNAFFVHSFNTFWEIAVDFYIKLITTVLVLVSML